jgi:hypothetical protein
MPRVDTAILATAIFLTCLVVNLHRYPAVMPPVPPASAEPLVQRDASASSQGPASRPTAEDGSVPARQRPSPGNASPASPSWAESTSRPDPSPPTQRVPKISTSNPPSNEVNGRVSRGDSASSEAGPVFSSAAGRISPPSHSKATYHEDAASDRMFLEEPSVTSRMSFPNPGVSDRDTTRRPHARPSEDLSNDGSPGLPNPPRSEDRKPSSAGNSSNSPLSTAARGNTDTNQKSERGEPYCDPSTGFCRIGAGTEEIGPSAEGPAKSLVSGRRSPEARSTEDSAGGKSAETSQSLGGLHSWSRSPESSGSGTPVTQVSWGRSAPGGSSMCTTGQGSTLPKSPAVEVIPLVPVGEGPPQGSPSSWDETISLTPEHDSSTGTGKLSGLSRGETQENLRGSPEGKASAAAGGNPNRNNQPARSGTPAVLRNLRPLPPVSTTEAGPSPLTQTVCFAGTPFYPSTGQE